MEPQCSATAPPMPHPRRTSSLWFVGRNEGNECNLPAEELQEYSRHELTLCDWSLQKPVITVTSGRRYNIYTIKSKKEELLSCGFLRESQVIFPFKNNPFFIIPDPVFTLCFRYLGHLKQYWVAGDNDGGQCGVDSEQRLIPLSRIRGLSDILKVKSGTDGGSTSWIKYDGSLYINGDNNIGQMGMKGADEIRIPTLFPFSQQHPDLQWVDGASSMTFTVLIADDGSVWFAGKMAYETFNSDWKFIPLNAPNDVHIVSVVAGMEHMLFLTQNGSVLSFGDNGRAQLGLSRNLKYEHSKLQLISFFDENDVKIQNVCCGLGHNLALSTDGKVYGWGYNLSGQCGVYDGANRDKVWTPESIAMGMDIVVRSIECGDIHSGLVTMDNEVYLWGNNIYNQCCANMEDEEIKKVFTPQNVTDYVLSKSQKNNIVDVFLGCETTMFLLD